MAADIDLKIIKKTQQTLGSVIKKPPLTDKLLKKPPFRFLHDIISNVIKSSGFMKGLYTQEELVSDNVKDKDSKIMFLQKAIDVLAMVTDEALSVKPSKIVAGHEPEKTNEFLQILAKAVISKMDSVEAVKKVLSGDKPVKTQLSNKKEKRPSEKNERKEHITQKTDIAGDKLQSRSSKGSDPLRKGPSQKAQGREATRDHSKNRDTDKLRSKTKDKTKEREASKERSRHLKSTKPEDSKNAGATDQLRSNRKPLERKGSYTIDKSPEVNIAGMDVENKENGHEPNDNDQHAVPSHNTNNTQILNGEIEPQEHEIESGTLVSPQLPVAEQKEKQENESMVLLISENSEMQKNENQESKLDLASRTSSKSSHRPSSAKRPSVQPVVVPSTSSEGNITPLLPTQFSNDQPLQPSLSHGALPSSASGLQSARSTRSARPSSARPAPPKIRIRHIVENEEEIRPPSAKPVENVILDAKAQSDDDDDEVFVVEEESPLPKSEPEILPPSSAGDPSVEEGSLVKQLLETKKDLEGGSQQIPSRRVEIDKSQMSEAARRRERETASKELEQLRSFIQTVSRTANPLGKMLDYLQEDVDSMQQEIHMWREEHQQNLVALNREHSITESVLDPLRSQLEDLEQAVQDQLDSIGTLKTTIQRNDERINRMLLSVNQQHKS